jgi:chromosomal replication initiation ATPase DnaA
MNEQKDVEFLLKNIQEGIRLYGVKELNSAISKTLYNKTDKGEDIEFIINMICLEFNVSRFNLIKSKKHGYVQKARKIIFCLLYFEVGLSLRDIGKIFGKYVRSVAIAIENYKKLNLKIKQDKEFNDLYLKFQESFVLYVKQKNKI